LLLPSNISTGRVTGQFLAGVVDGLDDDQDPDAVPAAGFVTFTASAPYLPDPTATPNPATILMTSVVAVLDNEGYLCTPVEGTLEPSYRGVRLIATDDTDLSVTGWTWNATYKFTAVNGTALAIPAHSFALPSNGTVDLTTVVKVPSSTGIGTEQAEALAASAQAAAISAAQDAATAAQAAVDAADAAQVTDANISALVGNPATDTADAVTALVDAAAADKLNVDDAVGIYQSQASLDAAAAAKVGTGGTSLNGAVKSIADTSAAAAAAPKLDAATAATTYAAKSVETSKLDASQKGAASGVAPLDSASKLAYGNFPDLSRRTTPAWAPTTAYAAGQAVLNPSGDLVTAKVAFTSGASYDAANWNAVNSYVPWTAGHIGIEKSNPVNARLYIGSGTGTLPDNGNSGIKVKIDTTPGTRNDGIASNVNLVPGSGDGQTRAIIGRLDVNDTATGDTTAMWSDVFVHTPSFRNVWAINSYAAIDAGVDYPGAAIGAELALANNGVQPQVGGVLHLVAGGTQSIRFGLKVGGSAGTTNIEHNVLMSSTTPPLTNAFYYGPLSAGNIPSGTPLFQINALGRVGIGAAPDATAPLKVAGRVIVGAGTEAGDAVNKGQLDAAQSRFAPNGALAVTLDRRYVASSSIAAIPSGTMRLSAVWLPKGATVSSITYLSGAVPVGLTNRWFALLDASRNLLRTTADDTGAWSAGSTRTLNLSSAYVIPADGLYYIGFCEVATTVTALRGYGGSGNATGIAPITNGDGATGLTNAASTPATSPSLTAQGSTPYAYVS